MYEKNHVSSEHSVFVQPQGSELGQTLARLGKKNGVKVVAAINGEGRNHVHTVSYMRVQS